MKNVIHSYNGEHDYLCGHQVELMGLWNLYYQSPRKAYKAKNWSSHLHSIFKWTWWLLILKKKITAFIAIAAEEEQN